MAKKISKEIKEEAIKLVEEHGVSITKVVKELGISRSTLDNWLKEYRNTSSNGLSINEKAELKRLEKKTRYLRRTRSF